MFLSDPVVTQVQHPQITVELQNLNCMRQKLLAQLILRQNQAIEALELSGLRRWNPAQITFPNTVVSHLSLV